MGKRFVNVIKPVRWRVTAYRKRADGSEHSEDLGVYDVGVAIKAKNRAIATWSTRMGWTYGYSGWSTPGWQFHVSPA